MSVRDKLLNTRTLLNKVFLHDPIYVDSVLASFSSKSNILLLGFRGSGKTHLMECLIKMVDSNISAIQQGYLSAELEDVFARPDIPSLIKGEEKVIFKKMVYARVKGFDEIQRLGVGALSIMFRLMTKGSVMYMDKEEGVKDFIVIATANPTEYEEDTINIQLPEPLYDRFDGVIWVPIAPLKYQIRINGNIDRLKEALPTIWNKEDLLKLWKEVEKVEIDSKTDYVITLINRIVGFCKFAQNYDASSLTETQKRVLCGKCSKSYICSRIARPPSVRAKLSLSRLSKGFAYLRGSNKVELIDVINAFPLVYWKRVRFMNDDEIADRYQELKELANDIINEIKESKQAIDLVNDLKNAYDSEKYASLENFVNSKIWLLEVKEDLDYYWETLYNRLKGKFDGADDETKIKIHALVKLKLPPKYHDYFKVKDVVVIELNVKNLAKLSRISKELFKEAKERFEKGEKTFKLQGSYALKWLMRKEKGS